MLHVDSKDDDVEKEVTVSFLHSKGPSPSFTYPGRADTLTMPTNKGILCKLNPTTAIARTYKVPADEMATPYKFWQRKESMCRL